MKAKKGNPFEKLIAYNLMLLGYDVQRIDDNTKGIDLLVSGGKEKLFIDRFVVECKFHKKFSWNEIYKILLKTQKETFQKFNDLVNNAPIFIFKGNQQPVLVAYFDSSVVAEDEMKIETFLNFFSAKEIEKIPKGYKVWRDSK